MGNIFDFEFLQAARSTSRELYRRLSGNERNLFTSLVTDRIQTILTQLEEAIPNNWLIRDNQPTANIHWQNFIGDYFLDLIRESLSNDEFEDRVFQLLKSLGFVVTQQGHTLVGPYPDGRAVLDDYILVYDCKNSTNFHPLQDDVRAMRDYAENERNVNPASKVFSIFIAKGFSNIANPDLFNFKVEDLLYLLYKKMFIGDRFNIRYIKQFLDNRIPLVRKEIDNRF